MNVFYDTILLVYAALFPIINPIGSAPLFLGLTQFSTQSDRNILARRVAFNSFFLLLGSLFVGSHVLSFFGIDLPVVRIGGGLVVTAFGWKLLNSETHPDGDAASRATGLPDAFYPLTMPLTVGPGSISVAITIGSRKPEMEFAFPAVALHAVGAFFGVVAIALSIYIAYRFAGNLARLLGTTGLEVMVRLSAFILMCIGIQIIWNGWSALSLVH